MWFKKSNGSSYSPFGPDNGERSLEIKPRKRKKWWYRIAVMLLFFLFLILLLLYTCDSQSSRTKESRPNMHYENLQSIENAIEQSSSEEEKSRKKRKKYRKPRKKKTVVTHEAGGPKSKNKKRKKQIIDLGTRIEIVLPEE